MKKSVLKEIQHLTFASISLPVEFSPGLGLALSGGGLFSFNRLRKRKLGKKLDLIQK